ncbi:hypothetical protein LQ327_32290 [Actinomycetospora endophytica]|uniref:Homeodomain-like domain-containing protein n=1 Tax=Actinomycetospora endophytica TaxID=2291215 RepID=A0ABS8PIF6_9PSEU|nr:hypothetical protein [Actinomycetospora endophytica]MCD2198062.1 hypothetical protein [Actinomycetospora endophytica]
MTAIFTDPRPGSWGRSGVKRGLTVAPSTRVVENDEFGAFARRILAAHGRRVASGDIEGLRDLDALGRAWERAMHAAVEGLRAEGFSWAEIGDRLGISRQATHQRWGSPGVPHQPHQETD